MNEIESFNNNRPEVVPYDTGKVKIGSKYVPPVFPMSEEEMEIQGIILGRRETLMDKFMKSGYEWIIWILGVAMVIYVSITI